MTDTGGRVRYDGHWKVGFGMTDTGRSGSVRRTLEGRVRYDGHWKVNPKSPDFESKHGSTAQLLCVDISNMKAQLEQSAILSILAFVEQLNYKLSQLAPSVETPAEPMQTASTLSKSLDSHEKKSSGEMDKSKTKALVPLKKHASDIITLKIVAKLGQVSVIIGLQTREVAQVDVAGLVVNVVMKGKDVTITSQLKDFTVIDPSSAALHPKVFDSPVVIQFGELRQYVIGKGHKCI
nr:uncharacterized protein LOC128701769 [Cherax quadricarinatus]